MLWCRCIGGADVRKSTLSNKIATVDAYLRITLGKHKQAPTKRSKVRVKKKEKKRGSILREVEVHRERSPFFHFPTSYRSG